MSTELTENILVNIKNRLTFFYLFLGVGGALAPPPVGQGLIHEVSRSHTTTHHSW